MSGRPLLTRRSAPAPVRMVHMGLGAFHRAHQAAYTAHAPDAAEWGIAAFTGRSPRTAEVLSRQGGLYTLIVRDADADRAEILSPVVEAHGGSDLPRFRELVAAPRTALVTLTVTEAAFRQRTDGRPDLDDPLVIRDARALREGGDPTTVLGRLLSGLEARRRGDSGGIAIVPCDNIPDNGRRVRDGLRGLAELVDPGLAAWVDETVSFVSTSVDRITPRTTEADYETAERLTGFHDEAPVVTEPFSSWVLSGRFPSERPEWEGAGAEFVADVEPYERRKIWLLNGAHTLLACAGLRRGLTTVAEAMADGACRAWVRELWDEGVRHLPAGLDLDAYRRSLEERFDNARIAHHLTQIAQDSSVKLSLRVAPVLRAERSAGRSGEAAVRAVAAWVALQRRGCDIADANEAAIAAARDSREPVRALVAVVDPELAADDELIAAVRALS